MLESATCLHVPRPAWPQLDPVWAGWRAMLGAGRSLVLAGAEGGPGVTAQLLLQNTAQWNAAAHWHEIAVQLSPGRPTPLRLAPHAQWDELQDSAVQQLAPDLRHAVVAHVSAGLRRCVARCLAGLGVGSTDAPVPLAESPQTQADGPTGAPGGASLTGASDPTEAPRATLQLRVHGEDPRVGWLALLPLDGLPLPAASARPAPCFDPRLPCRAVFGTQRLAPRMAQALRPGDAVLLRTPTAADGGHHNPPPAAAAAWLVCGDIAAGLWHPEPAAGPAQGRVAPCFPLTALHGPWSMPMTADDHSLMDPGEITLGAEAVIDAPPQRLSQIARWASGDLVTLAATANGDQVRLRVCSRAAGWWHSATRWRSR
jgi:hypothetical protein